MKKHFVGLLFLFTLHSFAQPNLETPHLEDISSDDLMVQINQAKSLLEDNYTDSALVILYNLEILVEGKQDLSLLNEIKLLIGKSLTKLSRFEESLNYYKQSVQISSELSDTLKIANSYKRLGISYKHLGIYPKAIEAYNQSNIYYILIKDTVGQGSTKINLGNIYKNIGQNERAKQKYHEAIVIFKPLNNLNSLGDCYNNIGNVFKNENNYDSARYYMHRTLEIRRQTNNQEKLSFVYNNIANLQIKMKNYDLAKIYADSAFAIKSERKDYYGIATELELFARIHYFKKEWNLAALKAEKALELAKPYHMLEFDKEVLRILGSANYKNGDYKKSAMYFTQYMEADETLIDLNNSDQLEFQLMNFELVSDSIQKEQLILKKELQEAENKNEELVNSVASRTYFLIIACLILLIFIIAYIYLLNRRRLNQSRTEKADLEKASVPKEEKEILLKEVHHRVKNNFQIIKSLIRIQSDFMNQSNYSEKLIELENRIQSMSLIHEKLYKTANLSTLNVQDYVEELSHNLISSFDYHENVNFNFNIDNAEYGIDSLIPLGLILNEAISNSIKHAFEDNSDSKIVIQLVNTEDNTILEVKDNGIGSTLSIEELKEESLGMELLFDLTEQLDGELTLDTNNGFKYHFKFPRLK